MATESPYTPKFMVKRCAYLLPGNTSRLRIEPAYVLPLLQQMHNRGQGDKSLHVHRLVEMPKDLPAAAQTLAVDDPDSEIQRLMAEFGVDSFKRIYPIDEIFAKAFEVCLVEALPGAEGAVPSGEPTELDLVDAYAALAVPSFKKEHAERLVKAGITVDTIANNDIPSLVAKTGLPAQLLRAIQSVAKDVESAPQPAAPSAPSEMRASAILK